MKKNQIQIKSDGGLPISLSIYYRECESEQTLVVILPGMKGFSNWGSFPYICERICESGAIVVCIDFSRNGVKNFGDDITQIELVEGDCPSNQVEEGKKVIEYLLREKPLYGCHINTSSIFVLGHSLGGATALLLAQKTNMLSGIITWSSIAHFNIWPEKIIENWKKEGRINMPNERTGQDYYLGKEFLKDVLHISTSGLLNIVKEMDIPYLIIHGEIDTSVPVDHAKQLFNANKSNNTLKIIPKADHTYGAKHPFEGTTNELESAINSTIEWIHKKQ
ncbi:MAG: prolyl oligopeptidase family serine peptidase [Candidatus Zixiibacteriota bacterium]